MEPKRADDDVIVDLIDVILRDGAVIEADAIISVADIPLVGLKLRAALAGMATMTEYGIFEEWDRAHRQRALDDSDGDDSDDLASSSTDRRIPKE
ncbi:gas vesicle protein GvpM [Halococcus qingdaonensis]|uniref:gas vesicle protein GvpM n=1 Tax=Halococcus qingdaonensis TaxID=224402 RepID=UPI00211714BF|nr:gas vesicle protein [Halococcus qingdaonensis]